jgi:hypothetical protein
VAPQDTTTGAAASAAIGITIADVVRPRSVVSRRLVADSGFRFVPWA